MQLNELLDELRVGVLGDVLGRVGLSNPAVLSLSDLIDETRAHLLKDVTGRVTLTEAAPLTFADLLSELRENALRDVTDAVGPDPDDTLFSDEALKRYLNEGYQRVVSTIVPHLTSGAVSIPTMVADGDEPTYLHPAYRMMLVDWAAYRAIRNMDADLEPGSGQEGSVQTKADGHRAEFDRSLSFLAHAWGDEQITRYINEAYQKVVTSTLPYGANTTDKVTPAALALGTDTPDHMNPAHHMALADWAAYRVLASHQKVTPADNEAAAEHKRNFELAIETMNLEHNDGHLTRYINEGYRRVLARIMPMRTDSQDITIDEQVVIAPGADTVALPSWVKNVKAAYLIINDERVPLKHVQALPIGEGQPTSFSTSANSGKLTVGPVPTEVTIISLAAVGAQGTVLSLGTDEPVFDEAFHMMLVDWAAFRAVRASVVNRRNLTPDQQNMLIAASTGYRNAYEEALRELVYNEKTKVGWPIGFKSDFYDGGC